MGKCRYVKSNANIDSYFSSDKNDVLPVITETKSNHTNFGMLLLLFVCGWCCMLSL